MTFTLRDVKRVYGKVARLRAKGQDTKGVMALFGLLIDPPAFQRRSKWLQCDVEALLAYTVTKKGGSLEQTRATLLDQIYEHRDELREERAVLEAKLSRPMTDKRRGRIEYRIETIDVQLQKLAKGVPSVKVVKRFIQVMHLNELWRFGVEVFHHGFQLVARRDRLVHRGYYVCIDENQTEFYGRRRLRKIDKQRGKKIGFAGRFAVHAKKGKNPGATGGHEYLVMTAHFFGSKITLPLVVFHRPMSRSSINIIQSFLAQIRAFKPMPKYLFFDRGFAGHDVYMELVKFGHETGVKFATPAKRDWGSRYQEEIVDGERRKQRKVSFIARWQQPTAPIVDNEMQLQCHTSQWVLRTTPELLLNFVAYWLPEEKYQKNRVKLQLAKDNDDDEIALKMGPRRFVSFFTNCNIHVEGHVAFFNLYRARWAVECTFKRRSSVCATGKNHQQYYRALLYLFSYFLLILHALQRMDAYTVMGERLHKDGQAITTFAASINLGAARLLTQ